MKKKLQSEITCLYSSVSKKIRVSSRLVSNAEYVVGGSDDDGSYFT